MSSKRSAFKPQNEKCYGSVEKMYIHLYTIPMETSTSNNELYIYWCASPELNMDLFNDFHTIFKKCKQYAGTSYTGELFSIDSLQKFKENLILLGVKCVDKPDKVSKISLQDGTTIDMNLHVITNVPHFNDMFDICFQNYDFHESFSYDNDTIEEPDDIKPLICVENGTSFEKVYIPQVELKSIAYKIVKTSIDNETLIGWFNTLVKNNQYMSVLTILDSLSNFNKDLDVSNTVEKDTDDGISINESVAPSKISKTEWINLFCELYLEEDKTTDILLSEVYQEYVIASGWSDTPTVSMAVFVKQLRALHKYRIKRRSKGMMLIGHTSLVSKQENFKMRMYSGNLSNRVLLTYQHPHEVKTIVNNNEPIVKAIGHKYAREVAFLLHKSSITLDYQTVAQFSSIPQLSSELDKIVKYIDNCFSDNVDYQTVVQFCSIPQLSSELDKVVKYIDNCINDTTDNIMKSVASGDIFLNFRKTSDECIIYFPFNKKYYDVNYTNTELIKAKSVLENTRMLKCNDELAYYEFGNFGNNNGVDLNWTDSFSSPLNSNVGDITSTRAGATINRVFKTTKPVANQQLRKDPQEPGICPIIAGL